jgi:uncharacterized repeat protein (TIGR03803 family)
MSPLTTLVIATLLAMGAPLAGPGVSTGSAQPLTPIFTFGAATTEGGEPHGALIRAADGQFYGTTSLGGSAACGYSNVTGCGTVYRTALDGSITTLHAFVFAEGIAPAAGVIQAGDAMFYGTTSLGGSDTCNGGLGCGTIYRIDGDGNLAVSHVFQGSDGSGPTARLVEASDGNFYGTAPQGGPVNSQCDNVSCGVVFKLTPAGVFSVVHAFAGAPDGNLPQGGLVQASDGFLYGTTALGGNSHFPLSCGAIYRVDLNGSYTVLLRFAIDGSQGCSPTGELYEATDGKLYGTASVGGANGVGVLFRFSPDSTTVDVVYSFANSPPSGVFPQAGVTQGSDGAFYGTTLSGGLNDCLGQSCGTIFRVTPSGLVTTYSLTVEDGCSPIASALLAPDGNFYVPVSQCGVVGGFLGAGTVLRLTPSSTPTTISALSPTSGVVGTPITVTGTNFLAATELTFAGPAGAAPVSAPFTIVSDVEIHTHVPAGSGPGPIAVITLTDAALSAVSFAPATPTISRLSPAHGRPGSRVTITGQSLTGATSVRFDDNGAFAQFSVLSDAVIQAVVPPGATIGKVGVTTPAGQAVSTQRFLPLGR